MPIAYVMPAAGSVEVTVTVAVCVAQSVADTVATTAGKPVAGATVTVVDEVQTPLVATIVCRPGLAMNGLVVCNTPSRV